MQIDWQNSERWFGQSHVCDDGFVGKNLAQQAGGTQVQADMVVGGSDPAKFLLASRPHRAV